MRARLFLITPRVVDVAALAPQLEAALAAGDVASLLIAPDPVTENDLQAIAETLVPIAQKHDVAALVLGNSRVMGRARADGIHIEAGETALKEAIEALQPKSIVGAGNIRVRHEAMEAGEAGADYIFFGLLDLEEGEETHRKTIDLGAWWADLFEPPCVLLSGRSMESVEACARTGADFVAVRAAVWEHPEGPAAAIAQANAILDRVALELPDTE
ncbi:Thiamine-phosphate synthase [Pleomorphomonas sp. T1.2MG-36]|uniref:thiamine phosphate synthase n=1 Tax=Pleomorphomonas sp. T1.2MG-36 TaxID=3041167 RepID=UPI00247761BB|nr:thiamine phosphate synthase [Pleomorphomonas sp. T1.2MG-36]CAI9415901.1 Thiamine-phosphate synthase [Pleomorphomonas sp. T1.2MG-36]